MNIINIHHKKRKLNISLKKIKKRRFWSPGNKKKLDSIFETAALIKKGKLSKADKEEQYSKKFMKAKKGYSAVESNINALQVHGLNKCPDKRFDSYKSYVSLSVLSRNIQYFLTAP